MKIFKNPLDLESALSFMIFISELCKKVTLNVS